MSDVPPPRAPSSDVSTPGHEKREEGAPKRPKYLGVALSLSLALALGCWTEGCDKIAFYRGERDHKALLNTQIQDEADRTRVEALYDRFTDVADAAHRRAVPMAAAILVLGAALMTLSARALSGRKHARGMLVQVVVAQGVLVVANYFVMRDVRQAEFAWQSEGILVQQRPTMPPEQYEVTIDTMNAIRRFGPPTWLTLRTFASALVFAALTSRKTRAFFGDDGAPDADP